MLDLSDEVFATRYTVSKRFPLSEMAKKGGLLVLPCRSLGVQLAC